MGVVVAGESLLVTALGDGRLLVPLRHVDRVVAGCMPVMAPAESGWARAALELPGELLPLIFARALLGEPRVKLSGSAKVLVLRVDGAAAGLWVDAVEDVVAYEPWSGELKLGGELSRCVAGFCAGPPAAPVLDAAALCHAAQARS